MTTQQHARAAHCRWGLLGLGLLALGGCVDMFTEGPLVAAPRWTGTTTAGPATIAECAPMNVDVAIYEDPLYLNSLVDGRAYFAPEPATLGARAARAVSTWWVDGYMNPDYFVQVETRRQRPVYFHSKPYAVWRGGLVEDGRIVLVESGSPCGRQLVLDKS
jgi:hypothetical protein